MTKETNQQLSPTYHETKLRLDYLTKQELNLIILEAQSIIKEIEHPKHKPSPFHNIDQIEEQP